MKRAQRVILIVESTRAYGRGCLLGAARYSHLYGKWNLLLLERGLEEQAPSWLKEWRPDGVIARIETRTLARSLCALNVPIVDLRGRYALPGAVVIRTDTPAMARLGADHFLERGFKHFAFCGFPGLDFSDQRSAAFADYLEEKGYTASVYASAEEPSGDATIRRETEGTRNVKWIANWLKKQPRPLALMACNDVRGRQILDACAEHGIRVPEDIAVLGVDNDELICELANPPLSSIEPDTKRVGFLAMQALHQMLRGHTPTRTKHLIAPARLVVRLSSDILAVSDPIVAEALRLIRQHACTGLNVKNLMDYLTVSRKTLERRFEQVLGYSPRDEIHRLRIQKARELLIETDYLLSTIAQLTGFKTVAHMSVAFKTDTGCSPGQFRIEAHHNTLAVD